MSTRDSPHRRLRVTPDPLRRRLIVTCACGRNYAVPQPSTTTMHNWLQRAQHAHVTARSEWTCRAGCHIGDLADFDHYLDLNDIALERAPEAFATYLALEYGWTGQFQRVDLHVPE